MDYNSIFDFEIDYSFTNNSDVEEIEKQRTEKWHKDREGKFTSSKIKELMACSKDSKSLNWDNKLKIIDLGEAAKKYIFSRAKERQRNIYLERPIGQNGTYGTEAEKVIIELIKAKYPDFIIEEVGFIEFIKGVAGASPDGNIINKNMGLEMKAATNWNGVYDRIEIPFTPKHQDFWQINSEMLALNVDSLLYVIAEPPKDLKNPEIKDISETIIIASKLHQKAIIERCTLGDIIIKKYLSGRSFSDALVLGKEEYLDLVNN